MPATSQLPSGVGLTALGTAQERRLESGRPDRLFHDPLAELFVTSALERVHGEPFDSFASGRGLGDIQPGMRDYIALRTVHIDQYVLAATEQGLTQVVVPGAGLDARAFRLSWPAGTRVFEIDTADLMAFKRKVIDATGAEPGCERVAIAADLRADWVPSLLGSGFDRTRPSAWIVEGLLGYLAAEDAEELLRTISDLSTPDSRLVAEHLYPRGLDDKRTGNGRATLSRIGAGFRSAVADPVDWFAREGWTAEVVDLRALAQSHGRAVPPLVDPLGEPNLWLADAVR